MAATTALEGEDGLPGKALAGFPSFFRADDRRVNLNKARDWWHKCEALPQEPDGERQRKYARNGAGNRHQFLVKTAENSNHDTYNKYFLFKGKLFTSLVTPRRIQDFTDRYDSVYRRLKGKKQVSSKKQREIYISAASHPGRLKRQFDAGLVNPDLLIDMDHIQE
ncbi:hypothetical protein PC116_g9700 [Phytophthora cactorum]|uniref:Uncharacterized protein n=1 Tax=Phytophthora cactorum TaxID=29920 RepID=A0A8T1DMT9_9STRA|nr:hypothetical protein Pcac1_g3935 [Phytophthora cactorum]KAG2915415.1 hypothetical protein PC114_g7882 [Phytophthora cactorum]KAG2940983.1 hypothetical protein PC117_g10380 [Phytophthora cactorum]KAG3086079.1 hypothetical protein PC122_g9377 [Phytophthora cactorum]KAG3182914.1 hypothetical protein C6341_g5691 [Phytophthora cactorum]